MKLRDKVGIWKKIGGVVMRPCVRLGDKAEMLEKKVKKLKGGVV